MTRHYFLPLLALCTSFFANAQTTSTVVAKALTDPKAAHNSAKADARLINQQQLFDTISIATKPTNKKTPGRKKKMYRSN